jgi:hypothetical protein
MVPGRARLHRQRSGQSGPSDGRGMPVTPPSDPACLCALARHRLPRHGRRALRRFSRRRTSGRAWCVPPPSKSRRGRRPLMARPEIDILLQQSSKRRSVVETCPDRVEGGSRLINCPRQRNLEADRALQVRAPSSHREESRAQIRRFNPRIRGSDHARAGSDSE